MASNKDAYCMDLIMQSPSIEDAKQQGIFGPIPISATDQTGTVLVYGVLSKLYHRISLKK